MGLCAYGKYTWFLFRTSMFTSGHHYNLSGGVRIPIASIPTSQNRTNNAAKKVAGNLHCATARQSLLYGIVH